MKKIAAAVLLACVIVGIIIRDTMMLSQDPAQASTTPMFQILNETDISDGYHTATVKVVEDKKTGCQYIATYGDHGMTGITPRLDVVGRIICGK